jgi:hypothetical protein
MQDLKGGNMMGPFWMWGWGFGWMMGFMMLYWLISLVFIVWALVRIASSKRDAGYKLIWAGIVIFLGIIGALVYYLLEADRKR